MLRKHIKFEIPAFRCHEEVLATIEKTCSEHADICTFHLLGSSEEGRALAGIQLGTGPIKVSLVAGAHSDEPIGPETLRTLILESLSHRGELDDVLRRHTFFVVPHINPDGEERNREWMQKWPDVEAYIRSVFRELPGRDVEFNYPSRRVENQLVSEWLASHAPFDLHMSLHGMGFSDGAMLLIEKNWTYRTEELQNGFTTAATEYGLRMHDHNRKGEKGFFYIDPGFTTTPEGSAMRTYFLSHDQPETAALFGDSSMEYVRSLGGDPLCLVTELPLFIVEGAAEPRYPTAYLEFKSELPEIRLALQHGRRVSDRLAKVGLNPLPIADAVSLQLRALELGLKTVRPSVSPK